MGANNLVFLEVIEWLDRSEGKEIVHRIPEEGSGEIKYGAQLIVRESQSAVFFYNGRAYDAFPAGRHTLKTANIPVLTKVLSLPWGLTSPLRAEVYFINMKIFPDFRWGTREPVAFKDSQLGLIRLRAFGMFNIRVVQPVLFINNLVGTQGCYTTQQIEQYLSRVVISRLNDYLGDNLDSFIHLPGRYDAIAAGLTKMLQEDFGHFGIALQALYVESITPPADVQQAIDDKSRLAMFDDMNRLLKMKTAMAMEAAAANQGEAGAGVGMGMGLMMPALFGGMLQQQPDRQQADGLAPCHDCKNPIPHDSRFCPLCGHQQLVFRKCARCGKNLPPSARFCPKCGAPDQEKPVARICGKCSAENLAGSVFCNQCGEKL